MNKLFTDEEIKRIFEGSLWQKEMVELGVILPKFDDFSKKMDMFCNAFPMRPQKTYLFGKRSSYGAYGCEALPFALYVEEKITCNSDYFCQEAFNDWEKALTDFIYNIYGLISYEELESAVGEITMPCDNWVKEKALSYILSGKQFKNMALKYPIYARQVIDFVFSQIEHIEELISTIEKELPEIYPYFFDGKKMPRVAKVSASSSDRHNGGKTVHLITFEDGSIIVYKPRKLDIDRAFNSWLNWCAAKAGYPNFLTLKSKDTSKGSFCEYARQKELQSKEELAYYFEHLGFLLGAVYLLRGSDLHMENIIAVGKEPVIIDMETLLSPDGCLIQRLMTHESSYSVNDMAILPMLGLPPGMYEAKFASLCYCVDENGNLPLWQGKRIPAAGYVENFTEGFSRALGVIINNKEAAKKILYDSFMKVEMRMVLKATSFYFRFLISLGNKHFQSCPDAYAKIVLRSKIASNKLPQELINQVFADEVMAYDRLDIPYFTDTFNDKMLGGFSSFWDKISYERVLNETNRIRFGLNFHAAFEGMDEEARIKEISVPNDAFITESARRQAEALLSLLEKKSAFILMPRNQDKYIILNDASKYNCLLDAGFGVIIALAAYRAAFNPEPDFDKRLMSALGKAIKNILDPIEAAVALTSRAMGMADGAAGYILGAVLSYELSILSAKELEIALSNVARIIDEPKRIHFSTTEAVYGCSDMLLALRRIPENFKTEKLKLLYKEIINALRESSRFNKLTEEEILKYVKEELCHYEELNPYVIYRNNTLRYGNAGLMYSYSLKKEALTREEKKHADKLLFYLCTLEHVFSDVLYPDCCIEGGLLHGMSGILYSICRYMNPDRVPKLW